MTTEPVFPKGLQVPSWSIDCTALLRLASHGLLLLSVSKSLRQSAVGSEIGTWSSLQPVLSVL